MRDWRLSLAVSRAAIACPLSTIEHMAHDLKFSGSIAKPVFTVLRRRQYRFSMRNCENDSEDLRNSQTGTKYRNHREIQWFCDQQRAVFQTPGHRFEPVRPLFPFKTFENKSGPARADSPIYFDAPVTRPTPN